MSDCHLLFLDYTCDLYTRVEAISKMFRFFTQVVLSTFEAQPLGGDEESLGHLDEEDNTAFKIKYLTSSKLMSLEVYSDINLFQLYH